MKKKIFLLGIVVLFSSVITHAQTVNNAGYIESLMAQVQYLQSLLQTIEGVSAVPGSASVVPTPSLSLVQVQSGACVSVTRNLGIGSTGEDVRSLQAFLAKDPSMYPEGLITGYYGALTVRAVERFQIRQGIASGGSPATTGFGIVGPKTRTALVASCGGTSNPAVSRDMVVTPRIGQVPLTSVVTFSLNGSSCSSFSLDWGDGSVPISFDAGSNAGCTKDIAHKEARHTYRTAGAYAVVLRAGQGPLSSAVEVSRVPVYVGVPVPASFSLSPTSGNAPLTTSVTFPVSGSSCTSFELDWGDGSVDRLDTPVASNCSSDVGTEARSHTYSTPGSYNVTLTTGQGPLSGLSVNERWTIRVDEPIGGTALSFLNTSGVVPFTANLALTAGEGICASYLVDWDDGTPVQQFDSSTSATCTLGPRVFTHTYITPGTYNVKTRVGEGSLNALSYNVQPIVVRTQETTVTSCSDMRPVCGELSTALCTSGYVCTPARKNYPNICAMQIEGAYLVGYGTCQ